LKRQLSLPVSTMSQWWVRLSRSAQPKGGGVVIIALTSLLRELVKLFVDDGALALAIVEIVAAAAVLATLMPATPLAAGAVLLFGCLGALLVNTKRAGRR
jgi:hypothetical protein